MTTSERLDELRHAHQPHQVPARELDGDLADQEVVAVCSTCRCSWPCEVAEVLRALDECRDAYADLQSATSGQPTSHDVADAWAAGGGEVPF